MAGPGKKYGLILPQKKTQTPKAIPASSVFGDDSDEETSVGESLQKEAVKKMMMKQTKLEMQKALEQDSSVYEYDSVYDDIQKQRVESHQKILGGTDKKPKYINQLLRAVEERKKEQERRDERKIQKEREAEGEKFADKDAYVTSAYRQKLKEREQEKEKERREAEMEAALDVKKQKDLSGFYRHLLNQTVGEECIPDGSTHRDEKPNVAEEHTPPPSPPLCDAGSADEVEPRGVKPEFNKSSHNIAHSKRQYRKQRSPSPGSTEEDRKAQDKDREKKKDRDRDRERERERDDRHSHRRDEKEHRREKDRGRERDDDQSRGRKERKDRHGRGEPRDRDREKEREKFRNEREHESKEQGNHKHREREKEREDDDERTQNNEKEQEKTSEKVKREEKKRGTPAEELASVISAPMPSKFAKRSNEQTVSSARGRYLARQIARTAEKSYIEKED